MTDLGFPTSALLASSLRSLTMTTTHLICVLKVQRGSIQSYRLANATKKVERDQKSKSRVMNFFSHRFRASYPLHLTHVSQHEDHPFPRTLSRSDFFLIQIALPTFVLYLYVFRERGHEAKLRKFKKTTRKPFSAKWST